MAVPSAYLQSTKNTVAILSAIQRAGVPPRFTYEFLKQLGFPSSSDRAIIAVLKSIGFLDESSMPTGLYRRFKDKNIARAVMAEGLRSGYGDVFAVDTQAHTKSAPQLTGIFSRLSEKGDSATAKMAYTFKVLASQADFDSDVVSAEPVESPHEPGAEEVGTAQPNAGERSVPSGSVLTLRHDIHVHLPLSTDVAVYDAIFRSLKATML